MDKTQLFEKLVSQYDYKLPAAPKNLNIIKFIIQYLTADLPKLVDYSINVSGSVEKAYAVNQFVVENNPGADTSFFQHRKQDGSLHGPSFYLYLSPETCHTQDVLPNISSPLRTVKSVNVRIIRYVIYIFLAKKQHYNQ
jgi:hypothetical protein